MNSDNLLYINKLLDLYLGLPETPSRASRYDRQLACDLYQRKLSLDIVEAALLLASARRLSRDPALPPLGPIRSLHYFLPVIEEVLATHLPDTYLPYLRSKLAPLPLPKPSSK
jgi:hypothetical protein